MRNDKSFLESATGISVKPLWVIRGFAIATLLPLLVALFVFKAGNSHSFCIGLSAGLLVGMIAQSFAISSLELGSDPQPSAVENISVVR